MGLVRRHAPHGGRGEQVEGVGSNSLRGGEITVQGLVTYAPGEELKENPYFFAITGGTGQYRAARGQVKIEEVTGEKLRLTFLLIR